MAYWIIRGFEDKEIAKMLGISVWTVNRHVKSALRILGARNRANAVAILAIVMPQFVSDAMSGTNSESKLKPIDSNK
ncbi:MAG: helix-turn-helix transcriptional regulator [Planctomycetes bacterium]|nr:helix-turn-helix transcriptional regulator [Planctomycetota bacterium]